MDNSPTSNIKSMQALCNGGIIVELDNEHLASWLQDSTGRSLMEGQFDTAVSFFKRTFTLVLEYLPIQLQIENDGFLQHVENKNNLPADSLATIRWIKSPNHRTQEQQKAFAMLHVTKAAVANNILWDGLCINNERIGVRKDKRELIHCVKCQQFGHIACACSAPMDICGTCSGNHQTTQCTAY
jgi:hypothetical protein